MLMRRRKWEVLNTKVKRGGGEGVMFLEKSYANERFTLMSGSTVRCFCRVCLNNFIFNIVVLDMILVLHSLISIDFRVLPKSTLMRGPTVYAKHLELIS